jgi:PiT family inorganic phosphate transporter
MQTVPIAFWIVALLVVLALLFDFMNGFHDAANSIATVVSTGVLKPHQAVVWAAFFNFLAIFIFQLKVAATIGKGIVDARRRRPLRDLRRAGRRDRLEHHHLVLRHPVELVTCADRRSRRCTCRQGGAGALVGPGIIKTVALHRGLADAGLPARCAADAGGLWASFIPHRRRMDRWFRRLQLVSAALYSLGHGSNDAQKTMGIIWLLLIAAGYTSPADACRQLGDRGVLRRDRAGHAVRRLADRQDHGPEDHQAQARGRLLRRNRRRDHALPRTGLRHSGVHHAHHHRRHRRRGLGAQKVSAVRWGLAGNIVWAWILTIPASAAVSALAWWVGRHIL